MRYEGYNGQITVEGDELVITREGFAARATFGKSAPRRIPLAAISGVTMKPPTRMANGWLQLHLGGETPTDLKATTAASNADTVLFPHAKRDQWTQVHSWLLSVIEHNRASGVDPALVMGDVEGGGQAGRFDKAAAAADDKAADALATHSAHAEERKAEDPERAHAKAAEATASNTTTGTSGKSKRKPVLIGLGIFVAILLVIGLVSGGEDDGTADTPTSADVAQTQQPGSEPEPEPEPEPEKPSLNARQIERTYVQGLGGRKIRSMCDRYFTHWSCFYDGAEMRTDSWLQVNLTTDGGWSGSDLDDMADTAGLHWFNFVGETYPELDAVIVYINGVDHGTTWRRDVPLLNR